MSVAVADTFRIPIYDVTLRKATSESGASVVRFSGIVSTDAPDLDGEIVKQDGIDFSYFDKQGFFRWHHTPKPDEGPDDPNAYVGKPLKRKVVKLPGGYQGTRVEGEFFDSPLAADIAEQQERMAKAGRSFGFSLEGKTVARDPDDKRIIVKSRVHNIAIDPNPVNLLTAMDLRKALEKGCHGKPPLVKAEDDEPDDDADDWPPETEDETEIPDADEDDDNDDLREGLDAGALAPITPESLSGGRARGKRRGRKTKMTKEQLKAALSEMSEDDRAELLGDFGHSAADDDDIRKAMSAHGEAMESLSKAIGVPRHDLSAGVATLTGGMDELRKALAQRVDMDDAVAEHLIRMGGLVETLADRVETLEKGIGSKLGALGKLDLLEPIAKALRLPGLPTGVTSVTEIRHPAGNGNGAGEQLTKAVASERLLAARATAHEKGMASASTTLGQAIAQVACLKSHETVPAADVERLCKSVGA